MPRARRLGRGIAHRPAWLGKFLMVEVLGDDVIGGMVRVFVGPAEQRRRAGGELGGMQVGVCLGVGHRDEPAAVVEGGLEGTPP